MSGETGFETTYAADVERFLEHVDRGNHERAIEVGTALANAQPPGPRALLADLQTALEAGDDRTARSLLDGLEAAYDAVEPEETARMAVATAATRSVSLGTSDEQFLNGVIQARGDAGVSRARLFTTLGLYLADEETETTRADAIDAVRRARGDERTFEQRSRRFDDAEVAASVDLAPTLVLAGARLERERLSAGGTTTLTVDVSNVGTSAATGVTVGLSLPDGLDGDTDSSVGRLSPDGSREVSLDVEATTAGSYTVGVEATAENATSATRSLGLTVEGEDDSDDDGGSGGLARFDENGNGTIDFPEVLGAITAFNEGGTVGGEPVGFPQVLSVITAFNEGRSI